MDFNRLGKSGTYQVTSATRRKRKLGWAGLRQLALTATLCKAEEKKIEATGKDRCQNEGKKRNSCMPCSRSVPSRGETLPLRRCLPPCQVSQSYPNHRKCPSRIPPSHCKAYMQMRAADQSAIQCLKKVRALDYSSWMGAFTVVCLTN